VRRAIEVLVTSGEITRRPFSRPLIEPLQTAPQTKGSEVHVWISRPIADGASLQFLRGISSGLQGTNYSMIVREPVRFFGEFVKSEEREFLMDLLNDHDAVGTILERDPFAENADVIAKLIERGKHLVFVDIPAPSGLVADHVGTANVASARKCVRHLLDLGHQHIACVTDTQFPQTTQDRIKGYWRAMRQAGIEQSGRLVVAEDLAHYDGPRMPRGGVLTRVLSKPNLYTEWAQKAVREILALDPRPTALFVTCDVLANWIYSYLEGMGFSIPGDFAIVGFDWLGRWNDPTFDVLTTAAQDFEGFGNHAADLIVDRAMGCSVSASKHVLLEAPLVIRSSSVVDIANSDPTQRPRPRY
jgi:DNA-binding LacI/PurR family transcriptional regulator